MEKNMFIPENSVELCGLITKVISNPKLTLFTVSCGYRGMKKDANGKYEWNSVTVAFYEKEGLYYAENFKKGDRVIVNCIAQTIRDHYQQESYTAFWGLTMEKESGHSITKYDYNRVNITGKIVSAYAQESGWVTVYIHTRLEKEHPDVRRPGVSLTDTYKSITPVRIFVGKDAETTVKEMLTKGTWVYINGHVYGRFRDNSMDPANGKKRKRGVKIEYIVAEDLRVIGQVQIPQDEAKEAQDEINEAPEEDQSALDEA